MTAEIVPFPYAPWSAMPNPVVLDKADLARVEIFGLFTSHELNNLSGELEKLASKIRAGERLTEEDAA
jgi:hypothetical protein